MPRPTPAPEPRQESPTAPELDGADPGDLASLLAAELSESLRRVALRKIFATPAFNARDGLDDYDHDYTRRLAAGEVLTADPRHRLARRARRDEAEPSRPAEETEASATSNRTPRAEADPAVPTTTKSPEPSRPPARYASRGRVLILDSGREPAPANRSTPGERAAAQLDWVPCGWLLSPEDAAGPEAALPLRWQRVRGERTRVEGVLGQFRVWGTIGGEELDLATLTGSGGFDLVLDLQDSPAIAGPFPPLGYFAPGRDAAALDRAVEELPELVGEFESPRFLAFRAERCAHGDIRHPGCTRCAAVCPVAAITAESEGIQIDPLRCQECGACAAACPTSALTLEAPWLGRFRDGLGTLLAGPARHAAPPIQLGEDPGVPAPMESVWAAGMELWLAALAAGAHGVAVPLPADAMSGMLDEFRRQMASARALLGAMGINPDALSLEQAAASLAPVAAPSPADARRSRDFEPAPDLREIWQPEDRRGSVRRALAALSPEAAGVAAVELPPGEMFGEVHVAADRCTLCMACAGVCPTGALHGGGGRPELRFTEAACVQCGQCVRVCPERAAALHPRYDFQLQAHGGRRTLMASAPFCCVRCGTPFSTPRMIDRVTERLVGHWMFPDEAALRRVQMCRGCRVVDLLESEDAQPPTAGGSR